MSKLLDVLSKLTGISDRTEIAKEIQAELRSADPAAEHIRLNVEQNAQAERDREWCRRNGYGRWHEGKLVRDPILLKKLLAQDAAERAAADKEIRENRLTYLRNLQREYFNRTQRRESLRYFAFSDRSIPDEIFGGFFS